MVGLTSASGLVGFLSEPDPELRVFALKTLDAEVDVLWTDIVDAIPQMYAQSRILLPYLLLGGLMLMRSLTFIIIQ